MRLSHFNAQLCSYLFYLVSLLLRHMVLFQIKIKTLVKFKNGFRFIKWFSSTGNGFGKKEQHLFQNIKNFLTYRTLRHFHWERLRQCSMATRWRTKYTVGSSSHWKTTDVSKRQCEGIGDFSMKDERSIANTVSVCVFQDQELIIRGGRSGLGPLNFFFLQK